MLMSCPECPVTLYVAPKMNGDHRKPVLHKCSGHGGMLLPMVQDGSKAKVKVVEREDYIGTEQPLMHDGRPIMAVTITREDGEDRMVFAPPALGGARNGLV